MVKNAKSKLGEIVAKYDYTPLESRPRGSHTAGKAVFVNGTFSEKLGAS